MASKGTARFITSAFLVVIWSRRSGTGRRGQTEFTIDMGDLFDRLGASDKQLDFPPEGMTCRLKIPSSQLTSGDGAETNGDGRRGGNEDPSPARDGLEKIRFIVSR